MPATTKKTAEKPLSDVEADSANPAVVAAEDVIRERPEGMPAVWPLHALPRRKRAAVELALADCVDALDAISKASETVGDASQADGLRLHANTQAVVQDVADTLALGSLSSAEFLTWADEQDEATMLQAFAWYMGTLQPGEAGGSQ